MLARGLTNVSRTPIRREFSSVGNTHAVDAWIKNILDRANTPASKGHAGQLSGLINYYNKPHQKAPAKEINWQEWDSSIQTRGVVEAIRGNYQFLMNETYQVEPIAAEISTLPSGEYTAITSELKYHHAIWDYFYQVNLNDLVALESVGNLNEYTDAEWFDSFKFQKARREQAVETMSYIPGSQDDVNYYQYFANQFAWGKMMTTFYRHPTDDYKCSIATKNILGR